MKFIQNADWFNLLFEKSKEAYILVIDGKINFSNPSAIHILTDYFPDQKSMYSVEYTDVLLIIAASTSDLNLCIPINGVDSIPNPERLDKCHYIVDRIEAEFVYANKNEMLVRLSEKRAKTIIDSETDKFYYSLFNTVSEGIFILDKDGIILEVNEGTVKMFRYPREYLIGRSYLELSAGNINELDIIKNCIQNAFYSKPQQLEFWGQQSNGVVFPLDLRFYKSVYFGKDVLIVLATDITERKQSEAKIEAYTLQLQEVNETRDKYYSIIAHDLRSSFSSILGLSELLTEDWNELEESRKQLFARNIFIAADNSYKLLQNLLDWAKHQSGVFEFEPVSFDLAGSINEICSLYRLQALRKDIKVKSEIEGQTLVFADLNMVQSILRNLISNAIKFSSFGGTIVISAQDYTSETKCEMLAISVSDSGVGISNERLQHIFEPKGVASTIGTDNEIGTGLGLLLCKEMAEQNSGSLWVKSIENEGSIFTFTIPKTALTTNN
jgi:PAS domain S-box-containing protein